MINNNEQIECCANCEYLLDYPKGNKYGDVEHLCVVTGYFTYAIHKDRKKLKHFSPGGKELQCQYKKKTN